MKQDATFTLMLVLLTLLAFQSCSLGTDVRNLERKVQDLEHRCK